MQPTQDDWLAEDLVEVQVVRSFEHDWVDGALAALPERQRTALIETYYNDASHQCIATKRKLSLGTVKTRIRDGLIRLRKHAASFDS